MHAKLINEVPERTYALILDSGDEVVSTLERFAAEHDFTASRLTAIGAFSNVTFGYFDWEKKDYQRTPIDEQLEVLSMIGDIALHESRPKLHAHVVLGRRDPSTCGGHLLEARVRPTLEVLPTDAAAHLARLRPRKRPAADQDRPLNAAVPAGRFSGVAPPRGDLAAPT